MPDSMGALAPVKKSPIRMFSSITAENLGSAEKALIVFYLEIVCKAKWVTITLSSWRDIIPWKSQATIRRYLHELEKDGWLERMDSVGDASMFRAGEF